MIMKQVLKIIIKIISIKNYLREGINMDITSYNSNALLYPTAS